MFNGIVKNYFIAGTKGKIFSYIFICLAVLMVYLPSFTGEFMLDDHPFIRDNEYIKEWHSIGSYLFQEDGYNEYSGGHTGYYRPLINISYTLDYKIWGLFGAGFKISNVILHLLVCFALLAFYNLILKNRKISLFLVLIFALHPVNTEAVAWVISRNNILVTLFGILSLHYYIKAHQQYRFFYYLISILFFTFSIFSKEFGLMLLPIFFLYQRTLNDRKQNIITEIREYAPYILIGLFYFFLRQNVTGSVVTPWNFSDILIRIYNFPYVLFLNLKLIFLPYNLHSFIIRYPESVLNFRTLLSISLLVTSIICIWSYRKNKLLLFSMLAFLFALFPVGGIIPTAAPTVISMRWLYFPSIFIFISLSQPLEKLIQVQKKITILIFICITLYLGVNSYTLNKLLWHSSETFFEQEVLHFNNAFYADGMARIYFNKKEYDLAEKYFKNSFDFGKQGKAHNYLLYSFLLYERGDMENSILFNKKAKQRFMNKSTLGQFHYNKGLIDMKLLKLDSAVKNIKKAILFSPEESVYWENLGVAYGMMGNHKMAVDSLENGIKKGVESDSIKYNLAFAYIKNEECHRSISLLERMKHNADDKDLIRINKLLIDAKKCINMNN